MIQLELSVTLDSINKGELQMKPNIAFGDFSNLAGEHKSFSDSVRHGWEDDELLLVKSEEFGNSRDKISAYTYSLLRTIEFEACWLISCPNSDFKILLGEKIGFDAVCLEALHNRMFEKLASRYLPTVSAAYSKNFTKAVNFQDESDISSFLYSLTQDFCENIDDYLSKVDRVTDEPTYLTLKNIKSGLLVQLEKLNQWRRRYLPIEKLDSLSPTKCFYSNSDEIPTISSFPGRSSQLLFSDSSIVIHKSYTDLMCDREKLQRFSHYVYMDVEITAMEVCAKNIVAYREMPLDFKLDMARQIWDEARHAIIMRRLLESIGGKEADYSYSAKVWQKCEKGENVTERLAIQQVFQEGNALESNFLLTEAFKNVGNYEMTKCMDFINADEAVHVKIGNFWIKYMLDGDPNRYQAVMEKAASLVKATLSSNVEVNRAARRISDFSDHFVDLLEENNHVYGYRKS
jgi:uncharacterized ferritin-like protein (DUF455 family)